MLDIYRASAGSGKTFALTLEYFKVIFENSAEYKHILAVTFTNKATEEMKSRIIKQLHILAEGGKSDYREPLKEKLKLSDEQIKNKASFLRTKLLHDYGRLSVTTIDRFFQRIIKAFTRELGIFPGYNVELDSDFVLVKAIDKVMQQVKNNQELRNWVGELMNNNVEEGKSWSIKSKITQLGEELFKEHYMLLKEDERVLKKFENKLFLKSYREFLEKLIQEYEEELSSLAGKALQLIRQTGLELADFKNGNRGCASWFYKLETGSFDPPTLTVRKGGSDPEVWIAKNSSNRANIEAIRSELMNCLQQAINVFDQKYRGYLSAKQLSGNLYQLGILHDLYQEVRNYCDEKGLMLLSDTTLLLNRLIGDNDTSFLFEKCGNIYNHLMIDEFQDTSTMQWKNFRPLVGNSLGQGFKVMIVGDVKQSIYRWRNGDWELLAWKAEEEFKSLGVNRVTLKNNWRSAKEIVAFNNRFFETATETLTRLYVSEAGEEDKRAKVIQEAYEGFRQEIPHQKEVETGYMEVTFGLGKKEEGSDTKIMNGVVETIQDILERGGKQRDVVVLVRGGKEGAFVADYFMDYNRTATRPIRFISNDSLYVSSSAYVQFIVAVLRYLVEPEDMVNKATILYFYNTFVLGSEEPLNAVFQKAGEEHILNLITDLEWDTDAVMSYSLYETIETIIERFALKDKTQEIPYLIAFQDIICEYETNNSNSITLFLEWWEKEQGKRVLSTSEEVDAVRILTIHKSKGLEFKYVILPFCSWELDSVRPVRCIWCHSDETGFKDLDYAPLNYSAKLADTIFREDYWNEHLRAYIDNLNLLYVAFTRAESELYIFPYRPERKKDGTISGSDMGAFISQVLEAGEFGLDADGNLKIGEKTRVMEQRDKQDVSLSLSYYPVWNPSDRISVKYRFRDYTETENVALSAIDEGKLLHDIFKMVKSVEDVDKSIQQVYLQGLIRLDEKAVYCAKIHEYLNTPATSTWFAPQNKVINEKDILFPNGDKARPDRVVFLPDGRLQVIDYKFGQSVEKKYVKQVLFYCDSLKKMGYTAVEGFVWYVKLGRIERVI